jgi:cytochrome c oxidase assembly factor CtaG
MSIWVDANGWPFPLPLLLGGLLVEILYFRGWSSLLKGGLAGTTAEASVASVSSLHTLSEQQRKSWFWRAACFLGALLVFLVASSAIIDNLSARLFWVHMVQHLLVLLVIAPLLVVGAPLLPLWLGLPAHVRQPLWRFGQSALGRVGSRLFTWLRHPAVSCAFLIVGLWIWHLPVLYDFALTNDIIHDWCEHATFLLVSLLFWSQIIPSPPLALRTGLLGRAICLGVAIAQNVVLAALLGFAAQPLYAPYAHLGTFSGGFTPLLDQQFGAGIMWTFGDLPFGISLALLLHSWFATQTDDDFALAPPHAEKQG